MQKDIFENLTAFNQGIFNSAKQLFEINAQNNEKLMENQMKFANMYIENSMKQIELASDFKDPKTYMATQGEMAKQCADLAITINKDVMAIATDTNNEFKTWFEKGLEEATKTVEKTVTSSKKAA